MTLPSTARRDGPSPRSAALRAQVGDFLIFDQEGSGRIPRIGEIIGVPNPDGSPPYLVRWLAGEYESTILPGPGARVEKRHLTHRAAA